MIKQFFGFLKEVLDKIDRQQINKLINELYALRERKGRLFILGVGGSAANASHAVSDFRKLCGIEAYCPTDNVAELTARINDDGWEQSFIDWLRESNFNNNDALLILSVGGGDKDKKISMNIIFAMSLAEKLKAKILGIVGRDGGETKKRADICVLIPNLYPLLITPIVESMQSIILHTIVFHPTLQINKGKWESIDQK